MKKKWDAFHEVIRTIAYSCYVVILVCIIYQVVLRFFFGKNTSWCEELSQASYICACFLGICFVEKENSHIRLDMIFDKFPQFKDLLEDIGRLLCIVYSSIIIISVFKLYPAIYVTKTKASGIPLRYIYGVMAFGSFMWALDGLINFIGTIIKRRRVKKEA